MWGIISAGILAVLAVTVSLAKAASRAEGMADRHREELMARETEVEGPGNDDE